MMGDKRALQAGTSHYLGKNFAKAFDVKFQTENNNEEYVFASSWGVSTRLIGAIIMVHGDENGLRLPPSIAPTQLVVVPFLKSKEELEKIKLYLNDHLNSLKSKNIRILLDDRANISPGYKLNEWELKGVPLRIEVGDKEITNNEVTLFRRDTNTKETISINSLINKVETSLKDIQAELFNQANKFMKDNIFSASTFEEFNKTISNGGFVRCGWDGTEETENKIKKITKATIRCIPFNESISNKTCILTGNPAKHEVVFCKSILS